MIQRFERQVERLGRRRAEQPVGVVVCLEQRFLLILAAVLADRARLEQLAEQHIAPLEAPGRHASRRAHHVRRFVRIGHAERTVLAAEEAGGGERLQLFAFADVETLADVDERRYRRIARAERPRDDRAQVRRRDRLRRRVAGVPLVLMTRVQDESEITGRVRANQRAAIHHVRDTLQTLRDLDVIDSRVDRREGAQHLLRLEAHLERRIALRIERLGVRHPAGHPEDDHGIGSRRQSLAFCGRDDSWTARRKRR